jgi:hypothetical protein
MWSLMNSCWAAEPADRPTFDQLIIILEDTESESLAHSRKPIKNSTAIIDSQNEGYYNPMLPGDEPYEPRALIYQNDAK